MDRQAVAPLVIRRADDNELLPIEVPRTPKRHSVLRARTAAAHDSLDGLVSGAGYFDSVDRYAVYIDRMLGFQNSFDRAAAGICDAWLDAWSIRSRIGCLEDDRASLDSSHRAHSSVAEATALALKSPSQLLGGLYVVMGAGLGSRILVTRARRLPLPSGRGVAYLSNLSVTTRWQDFLRFLEIEPNIDDDDMCDGALQTFECVANHLGEHVAR